MREIDGFFAVFGSGGGSSSGPSGSGTNNYLARWTPDGNTLGDSIIQDDGTSIGIGVSPNSTGYITITQSSHTYGMILTQSYSDPNPHWGIAVQNNTASLGTKTGFRSIVQNGSDLNIGYDATVTPSATSSGAIGYNASITANTTGDVFGAKFSVSNSGSGNAYAINLSDGTEGAGKVLTSDASGNASWQTASGGNTIYTADDVITGTSGTSNRRTVDFNGSDLIFRTSASNRFRIWNGSGSINDSLSMWDSGSGNMKMSFYNLTLSGNVTNDAMRIIYNGETSFGKDVRFSNAVTNLPAANTRVHITGNGATSATTSLLVENSLSNQLLKIDDDGRFALGLNAVNNYNTNVIIGKDASSSSTGGWDVIIGDGAQNTWTGGSSGISVAVGKNSRVSRLGTVVGYSAIGDADTSISIHGAFNTATGQNGRVFGDFNTNNGIYATLIGSNVSIGASGDYSIVMTGRYGGSDGANNVVIGGQSRYSDIDNVVHLGSGSYDKGANIWSDEDANRVFGNMRSPKANVHWSSGNQGVHHYYPTLHSTLTQNNIKQYVDYNNTSVCSSTASATASFNDAYSLDFGANAIDLVVGDVIHIQGSNSTYQTIAVVNEISGSIVTLDKRLPNNNNYSNVYNVNATVLADATIIKVSKFDFVNDGNFKVKGQVYSTQGSTITVTANASTFDGDNGNSQPLDLASATADITLTFTNLKAGSTYFIPVTQKASSPVNIGTYVISGGTVKFPSGTAPTISTGASAIDTLVCYYDGTDVLVNYSQNYS